MYSRMSSSFPALHLSVIFLYHLNLSVNCRILFPPSPNFCHKVPFVRLRWRFWLSQCACAYIFCICSYIRPNLNILLSFLSSLPLSPCTLKNAWTMANISMCSTFPSFLGFNSAFECYLYVGVMLKRTPFFSWQFYRSFPLDTLIHTFRMTFHIFLTSLFVIGIPLLHIVQ